MLKEKTIQCQEMVTNEFKQSLQLAIKSDCPAYLLPDLYPKETFNKQDIKGNTLLHIFAYERKHHLVAYLLLNGANPEIVNKQRKKPFDMTNSKTIRLRFTDPSTIPFHIDSIFL
jgi:ankyrin repeat protein